MEISSFLNRRAVKIFMVVMFCLWLPLKWPLLMVAFVVACTMTYLMKGKEAMTRVMVFSSRAGGFIIGIVFLYEYGMIGSFAGIAVAWAIYSYYEKEMVTLKERKDWEVTKKVLLLSAIIAFAVAGSFGIVHFLRGFLGITLLGIAGIYCYVPRRTLGFALMQIKRVPLELVETYDSSGATQMQSGVIKVLFEKNDDTERVTVHVIDGAPAVDMLWVNGDPMHANASRSMHKKLFFFLNAVRSAQLQTA
jgi:hypothetical protein